MKQIHIFTLFGTASSFFDGQFKYLTTQGYEIILVSSYHHGAEAFAIRNNIRFIPIDMPRAMAPIMIVKAIYSIIKLIKQEKPDVVFGHTPVGAFCAMIASKLCGLKNRVYYRHGIIYSTMMGMRRKIFYYEEKLVAALASNVINVSHSLSRLAIRDRLNPPEKNNVIGYGTCGGIDAVNCFNPDLIKQDELNKRRSALGLTSKDQIIFGFCGRICKDKGISELVMGYSKFKQQNSNINTKLVLIGDYDERDTLPSITKIAINSDNDIIVTGRVDKSVIAYYYAMLDVFVFPSYREGYGMSVLEASAMKKPILVSRSHGCEDSIIEYITGEYVDLTADNICRGMEVMLDKQYREFLGNNGRNIVLERYDVSVMWPLVSELYKNIIE